MAFAKLISTDYVFTNSIIDRNVDVDMVNKFIDKAQDINVQQVIGHELYQKIMNDIADTGTTTGFYFELLVNHIQPTQTKWLVYSILPYLNYHLTNKSVAEKSSDNSQPTELKTLQYLRADLQSDAEYYDTRMAEYLKNNIQNFPELFASTGVGRIQPKLSDNYFGGLYLPRRKRY